MAKNMTRKGLAIAAAGALSVSGLVGAAPAFAADSVVTSLASGTSFNSVVGYANELKLKTVMSPSLAGNETTLNYRISNPSGATLEVGVANSTTSTVAIATTNQTNNTAGIWEYGKTAYSTVDADAGGSQQTTLTDFVVVPLGNKVGEADDDNFITIGVKDGDADVTVTVTAWLDSASDATNVQDSVEVAGNTVTLNFYDQANVSATTTMVTPVNGASSVQAKTVTSPELNGQQLGDDFIDVAFTAQGNANAVLAENTSSNAAVAPTKGTTTYDGDTKTWTSTAYLKYSDADDAWNGTDSSVSAAIDLSATTAATIAVATTSKESTVDGKTTGLGDSNSGTFAVTIDNLDTATGGNAAVAADTDVVAKTVTIVDADTFKFTDATSDFTVGTAQAITGGSAVFYSVGTNATVQADGVYSATPYIGTTKLGAVGSSAGSSITADDTKAVVVGTSSVEEGYDDNASSTGSNTQLTNADVVEVKKGTSSVTATATIYYTDSDDLSRVKTVGAGIPVTGAITAVTGAFKVNGVATSNVQYTDANGQVSFTVSSNNGGLATDEVTLDIRPQSTAAANAAGALFRFVWNDASYTLFDLNYVGDQPSSSSHRHMNTGGVYTYGFALLDQWGQPAAADTWRLQVVNSGRTVSSDTHTLSNGRVSVGVADGAQGSGSTITSTVNVQKLVSGAWATQTTESWDGSGFGTVVINVADSSTETVKFDTDSSGTTYQSSVNSLTADLADAVAAAAVEAQDRRTSSVLKPTYTNDVIINGEVQNALTGVAKGGTYVTLSGPSNILFSYGQVDTFGSITVPTDANGHFGVTLYSNTAQKDTVITATSANGASKTVKVTFDVATARSGTDLTITATGAEPGKTAVFTGTLTDKWGNPVDTDQDTVAAAGASALDATDARLTVSYTGPGLLSGSLPVQTGADGTFTVRVLLGSNDSGTMTVTATYGAANGSISSADTGTNIDITSALTVTVGGETPDYGSMTAWTKNMGDGTAKVYIKFPTIGEKVRIGHQKGGSGSYETIYVKTLDSESHPDLTVNANGSYIVRTIDLVDGTNRIRVTVGDTTEVQVRYNE